ncbi:MAG: amidohydrolase family protein, partial [Armatimonadetes bacterium]|nr:amidohydrolase family protein [Armatimonadota bacterium]
RLLKGELSRDDPYGALQKKLGWELPGKDPTELAARWVEEMDGQGVERMVLMPGVVGDEESVSAAVKAYPERFTGYVMIDPTQDDAVSRAHRALTDLGLRGITLFPAMHHFYAWDERFFPVYEEANRQGVPVFVHFGILKMGIRDRLGIPSKFDMRFSNPLDLSLPAREFPEVQFIIPHFGCGFFRET